jgi:hypothetical protein
MKMPLINFVRWKDASHSLHDAPHDYAPLKDLQEIGWLIEETDEVVKLSMEFDPDDENTRIWLVIPKVNIVERRQFKLPRRRKPNKTKELPE